MQCKRYIEQMNSYLDGALPASQISELLEHLEECPSCRARFEALKIISFEMRHMQVKPPAALHENIMQAVRRADQRRPRSYTKWLSTVVACAALLFIAINGNLFEMAGNYLFTQEQKDAVAGQDSGGAALSEAAITPDAQEQPVAPEYGLVEDAQPSAQPAEGSAPVAPESGKKQSDSAGDAPTTQTPAVAPNQQQPATGGGQSDSNQNNQNPVTEESQPRAFTSGPPPQETEDVPAPRAALTGEEPFRMPALDTDEAFAFYCVALGTGELPNSFDAGSIVHLPEKKCLYVYVDAKSFTQQGCENLLKQAGFTVMTQPTNLPATKSEAQNGLIVIYEYN